MFEARRTGICAFGLSSTRFKPPSLSACILYHNECLLATRVPNCLLPPSACVLGMCAASESPPTTPPCFSQLGFPYLSWPSWPTRLVSKPHHIPRLSWLLVYYWLTGLTGHLHMCCRRGEVVEHAAPCNNHCCAYLPPPVCGFLLSVPSLGRYKHR